MGRLAEVSRCDAMSKRRPGPAIEVGMPLSELSLVSHERRERESSGAHVDSSHPIKLDDHQQSIQTSRIQEVGRLPGRGWGDGLPVLLNYPGKEGVQDIWGKRANGLDRSLLMRQLMVWRWAASERAQRFFVDGAWAWAWVRGPTPSFLPSLENQAAKDVVRFGMLGSNHSPQLFARISAMTGTPANRHPVYPRLRRCGDSSTKEKA